MSYSRGEDPHLCKRIEQEWCIKGEKRTLEASFFLSILAHFCGH